MESERAKYVISPGTMRNHEVTAMINLGCVAGPVRGDVVISEIMYNSPLGRNHEYLEIHNTGGEPVDIGGWALRVGIDYVFAFDTVIPAAGFLVVGESRRTLLADHEEDLVV